MEPPGWLWKERGRICLFIQAGCWMVGALDEDRYTPKPDSFTKLPSDQKWPTGFVSVLVRNEAHGLPYFLGNFENLSYPKDRIHLWIRSDHNQDNTVAVLNKWISAVQGLYYYIDFLDGEVGAYEDERGPLDWSPNRMQRVIELREEALNNARELRLDYFLTIDADNFLVRPDTLAQLMSQNKTIVSPMLTSDQPYANFWGGMGADGFYQRTKLYRQIREYEIKGCFQVPMVHSTVLVNLHSANSAYLTYDPHTLSNFSGRLYAGPIDDSIVFAKSAQLAGLQMWILNSEAFGLLMVPLDEMWPLEAAVITFQALIALDRLGADEARIAHQAQIHGAKLQPAGKFLEQFVQEKNPPSDFPDIQGQSYYYVLDTYHRVLTQEHRGSIPEFLAAEFPKVSSGMSGGAFHGTIQLGYGLAAGHSETIMEGMAWLKFTAALPNLTKEKLEAPYEPGTEPPVNVLASIRKDENLRKIMEEGEQQLQSVPSRFARRLRPLIQTAGTAKKLLQYVNQLALGGYPSRDQCQPINTDQIGRVLVHLAVLVYTTAKVPNDFFLLHGVTAGWSLRNILHYLEDEKDINAVVRVFLVNLLGTYLVQDAPELDPSLANNPEAVAMSWDQLKQDVLGRDRDEHMYKLVQVCWDMREEDPANDTLYKSAALSCLKHPYEFGQFEAMSASE